jgi:hypothetical protein
MSSAGGAPCPDLSGDVEQKRVSCDPHHADDGRRPINAALGRPGCVGADFLIGPGRQYDPTLPVQTIDHIGYCVYSIIDRHLDARAFGAAPRKVGQVGTPDAAIPRDEHD